MSDYIKRYRNRTLRRGKDAGEFYENNTIAYIESTFADSPTFRVLKVNSTEFPNIQEIDARVVEVERMGSLREILFRPKQYLNIGTYVEFDNRTWIVSDAWGDTSFTSKVLIQRCNQKLKFAISEDWADDGLVDDSKIFETYCVSSQSPLGSKATQGKADIGFNQYSVMLPTGQLFVYLEKNSATETIKLNKRLIFGSSVYEVYGVDDTSLTNENGFGIIQLTIKLTTSRDSDDFKNQIAFNGVEKENLKDSISHIEKEEEDKGGRLW